MHNTVNTFTGNLTTWEKGILSIKKVNRKQTAKKQENSKTSLHICT